jgi:hypothetical protein
VIKCPRAVLSTSRKLSYTLGPLLLVTVTLCCAATQLSWCPQPPLYIGVVNIGGSKTFAVECSLLFGSQLKVRSSYRQPYAATDRE